MMRKVLLVLVFVGLLAIVGCKKEEPITPNVPAGQEQTSSEIQKGVEQAADTAAKEADAAKDEAGKQLENLGKDLQK
ncbi:MAG: hypothetical protein ABFD79_09305 [Phycisphaerales bacterium]